MSDLKIPKGFIQGDAPDELWSWTNPSGNIIIDRNIISGFYMEMYIYPEGWRRYSLAEYDKIRVLLECL
jgi:hypothetical protein